LGRIGRGRRCGILEFDKLPHGGCINLPAGSFSFCGLLGLREKAADVSEGAGAAGRDAVGGESGEEPSEDVVDIDLGDEVAGGRGELGGEIVLAGLGIGAATVSEAEAVMLGMRGEAAHASIGEGEFAKVEGVGWSRVRHGESIAKKYYNVKILVCTDMTFLGGVFECVVEKWRSCGKVHS
jgi:hypothetical protein